MAPRKSKAGKPAQKPITKRAAIKARKGTAPESKPERPVTPFTSQAARKRRMPTCSMTSLRNLETEVMLEEKFLGLFGEESESHYTWGKTRTGPIMAITRKGGRRRAPGRLTQAFRDTHPGFEMSPETEGPNSPERSPLLRVSLEIRERIYSYLLIYRRPIIVEPDWGVVLHRKYRKIDILFTCKQISEEAISFLYRNNAFRAALRPPTVGFFQRDNYAIQPKFVFLFKNVIIQCEREFHGQEWLEKAYASVKVLVDAHAALDAITIVTVPQRTPIPDLDGEKVKDEVIQDQPITFADFFEHQGCLMTELRKLKCKVLNVVVKKSDEAEEEGWRLLISLDLKYFQFGDLELGALTNLETKKLARKHALIVEKKMRSLKTRFEEVFEDDDQAQVEGKCRLLDEEETYERGLDLVKGTCKGFQAGR